MSDSPLCRASRRLCQALATIKTPITINSTDTINDRNGGESAMNTPAMMMINPANMFFSTAEYGGDLSQIQAVLFRRPYSTATRAAMAKWMASRQSGA